MEKWETKIGETLDIIEDLTYCYIGEVVYFDGYCARVKIVIDGREIYKDAEYCPESETWQVVEC